MTTTETKHETSSDTAIHEHRLVTDREKVIAQMRQYIYGDERECRASGHTLASWANTLEQEQQQQDEQLPILVAALRALATDIHNEAARISRGGRVDVETMTAWHQLADQVIDTATSQRSRVKGLGN